MSAQYQTVALPRRLPLVTQLQNRDESTGKDSRLVNCFAEKDLVAGDYWVEKRPGLNLQGVYGGYGKGQYDWNGVVYTVWGSSTQNLYKYSVPLGDVGAPANGIQKRFVQMQTTNKLIVGDGTNNWWTDGTTINDFNAAMIAAGIPLPAVPGYAYLDGTLYIMTLDGKIWGTANLDDPTVWNALNYISAASEPGNGVYLTRQLAYVIALKQFSSEAFYDAGNAAPASPLSKVQGAQSVYGCLSSESVQTIDGVLFWLSANRSVSPQVVMMNNLQVQVVSTPAVERLLDNPLTEGSNYSAVVLSWVFRHGGHRFYGLTVKSANVTLVYDIDQQLWYQWTDTNGDYWPIVSVGFNASTNRLAQHETNGWLYALEGDYVYPTDYGDLIPVDIYTPNFDAGVDRRKHLKIMRITADQSTGSLIYVRCSDNDYQDWSNFRTVDLGARRPLLTECGTFYRRAYHFHHYAPTALRIKSIDLQYDIGTL